MFPTTETRTYLSSVRRDWDRDMMTAMCYVLKICDDVEARNVRL